MWALLLPLHYIYVYIYITYVNKYIIYIYVRTYSSERTHSREVTHSSAHNVSPSIATAASECSDGVSE